MRKAEADADAETNGTRTRIVLLGMRCTFTGPVLATLLAEPGIDLWAVVLPGPVPPSSADPVTRLAAHHAVPVIEVETRAGLHNQSLRAALEAIGPEPPDLIVVACFPWRIPAWLRSLAPCGCLNIHPSLLPDGRGPEPVYWAIRRDVAETGVTLHHVDAGLDTGPIVAQRRFAIPEGATLESLERDLATRGARLLLDTLPALCDGAATALPQSPAPHRHAPVPGPDDLAVPTSWRASHAARFIRAVTPTYGPLPICIEATGQRLAVSEVIDADDAATIPEPLVQAGATARIRFASGVLTVRLHAPPRPLALVPCKAPAIGDD